MLAVFLPLFFAFIFLVYFFILPFNAATSLSTRVYDTLWIFAFIRFLKLNEYVAPNANKTKEKLCLLAHERDNWKLQYWREHSALDIENHLVHFLMNIKSPHPSPAIVRCIYIFVSFFDFMHTQRQQQALPASSTLDKVDRKLNRMGWCASINSEWKRHFFLFLLLVLLAFYFICECFIVCVRENCRFKINLFSMK